MRRPPAGAHPGHFVIDPEWPKPRVRIVAYRPDNVDEHFEPDSTCDLKRIRGYLDTHTVTWVDIQGLGDADFLHRVADFFELHPLAIADVVNVPQRPKAETYNGYMFLITKMVTMEEDGGVNIEQVSAFLGPNYLLTFQEQYGDVFDPVRERIRNPSTRIRGEGADYLAYAVLDAVVDGYYPALEQLGERLLLMEEDALDSPTTEAIKETNKVRRTLLSIRRVVWPQREAINSLIRDPSPLINDRVRIFLRDAYDHCAQSSDLLESYRELLNGVANLHLTALSNKTNDVMKMLTIVATIFIPLTFMTGIYGMNFEYMPELQQRWAYPAFLMAMGLVALGMVFYFKTRGLLGDPDAPRRRRRRFRLLHAVKKKAMLGQ